MTPATAPVDGGISISAQEAESQDREHEMADDAAFSERRAAFVAAAQAKRQPSDAPMGGWWHVIYGLSCAYGYDIDAPMMTAEPASDMISAHAAIDGWPATLRALAQAMAESEKGR